MILEEGEATYLAQREGGIAAWFGETLDQLNMYDPTA